MVAFSLVTLSSKHPLYMYILFLGLVIKLHVLIASRHYMSHISCWDRVCAFVVFAKIIWYQDSYMSHVMRKKKHKLAAR